MGVFYILLCKHFYVYGIAFNLLSLYSVRAIRPDQWAGPDHHNSRPKVLVLVIFIHEMIGAWVGLGGPVPASFGPRGKIGCLDHSDLCLETC